MTYIAHDPSLIADARNTTPSATKAAAPGFWRNVLEALKEARRMTAEREIARYIHLNGGVLTDSLDREIGNKYINTRD